MKFLQTDNSKTDLFIFFFTFLDLYQQDCAREHNKNL